MIDRTTIAEQLLKIAQDLEFGLVPEVASRELRKLVQEIQPGAGIPPSEPNEVARWNVTNERLHSIERELQAVQKSLQLVAQAGATLKAIGG